MKHVTTPAFVMLAWLTIVWGILIIALNVLPGFGFNFYPGLMVRVAAVFPLVIGGPIAAWHWRKTNTKFDTQDRFKFAAIVTLGASALAFAAEAIISFGYLRQIEVATLWDVLRQPMTERYSITTVFGLSFWACATLSSALASAVFFPLRLLREERFPRPK